jgi:thioredoxin reductase
MYDAIIIGGSYAGLAAALQLARARRRVLIVDSGQRRNRFASHSHGFLGQDGQPPGAIAAKGRAEVLAYPTVTWRDALASGASAIEDGFVVRFFHSRTRLNGPFAEQLGCEVEMGPLGPYYKADATKETTVRGVFACGDVRRRCRPSRTLSRTAYGPERLLTNRWSFGGNYEVFASGRRPKPILPQGL